MAAAVMEPGFLEERSAPVALESAHAAVERLSGVSLDSCHGRSYGFEKERATWTLPRLMVKSQAEARPGYDSMSASEYADDVPVLRSKVRVLAQLLRQAKCCVIYSGAGLSTGAGIGDYASQAPGSLSGAGGPPRNAFLSEIQSKAGNPMSGTKPQFTSPLCAQPTLAHRVIVGMHKAGHLHRVINQNHDGLPQKAGLPQEAVNEIHGAWHAPDNPVVAMSGELRSDFFNDLLDLEARADLSIAVGTSLCGMNADRVVSSVAERASRREAGSLGSVIIGLQQTVLDKDSTLRIFGRCDDVFAILAEELELDVAPAPSKGEYFVPEVLRGRDDADYIFKGISYDPIGERSCSTITDWDLRDDTQLVIPSGMHAGAVGVIDGYDREGNLRCRFTLKPKVGKLRAPVPMLLGRWWIQAAVEGTVQTLPVVNLPSEDDMRPGAEKLREMIKAYAC
eukprot:TRINITY_DN1402_c0_g1_i1.p1 TRINITY_DN1402_c0_g1~~TRINITY_DN1402_c0_g1_i1.p1  ORF type:complete len:451 (-),score=90.26 TRINITY_DN1402_c0_g1_i1:163-1515(-)